MSKLSALTKDVKANPALAAGAAAVAVAAGVLTARSRRRSPAAPETIIQPAAGYTGFGDTATDAWMRALDLLGSRVGSIENALDRVDGDTNDGRRPAPEAAPVVPPGRGPAPDAPWIGLNPPVRVTDPEFDTTWPVEPIAEWNLNPQDGFDTTWPVEPIAEIAIPAPIIPRQTWTAEGGINPLPWSVTGREADTDGNRIADGIDEIVATRRGLNANAPQAPNLDPDTVLLLERINREINGNNVTIPVNPAPVPVVNSVIPAEPLPAWADADNPDQWVNWY
jgi:hypothetical protein